jgi:hypothetical protein
MADFSLQGLMSLFAPAPVVAPPPGLYQGLMQPNLGVNPALLDNKLYPYDPNDKESGRLDRYREDEPGLNELARKNGPDLPQQGDGTAPAIPPQLLLNGGNADRRGEAPDPQWLREYWRKKNSDSIRA